MESLRADSDQREVGRVLLAGKVVGCCVLFALPAGGRGLGGGGSKLAVGSGMRISIVR